MSRRVALVAVAGVALLLAGVELARQVRAVGVAAPPAAVPRWPVGAQVAYDFAVVGHTEVATAQVALVGTQAATLDLAGALVVRSLGADPGRPGATRLVVGFGPLARHQLAFGSASVVTDAIASRDLEGHQAFVTIDPDGTIVAVRHRKGENELFRRLSTMVVARTQVTMPPGAGARWTVTEPGPSGRGPVVYARSAGAAPGTLALTRQRLAYEQLGSLPGDGRLTQRLAAGGHVVLAADHSVETVDDDERLEVVRPGGELALRSTTKFHLARRAAAGLALPDAPVAEAELEVAAPAGAAAARALLEAQAGGMTGDDLASLIRRTVVLGAFPDAPGWMARAVALIELHPELCDELVAMFGDQIDPRGMGMVLDVLAAAGTAEAQAAMRAALATEAAHRDAATYLALLQRWGSVAHPDTDAVAFVTAELANGHGDHDADLAHAAAYALGAMAGHLDAAPANAVRARLIDDLAAGPDDDRAALAGSLGNAGRDDDVARLAALGHDDVAAVRAAAASALRKMHAPAARRSLIELLSDRDPAVQLAALHALAQMPVDGDDVTAVAALISAGQLAPALRHEAAQFLGSHLDVGAAVRTALAALLDAAGDDPMLQAAIRQLLA